jgi:hypothetical protein
MVKDDHTPRDATANRPLLVILILLGVGAAAGFLLLPRPTEPSPPTLPEAGDPPATALYFRDWPTPDVALVITGQTWGYLQPCGCSEPQKGGLARRYNFLRTLTQDRHWPVVLADLGDVASTSAPQALLRYRYAFKAMGVMGYTAVGVGANEMAMPLFTALGELLNEKNVPPVLAGNLKDMETKFPGLIAPTAVTRGENNQPRLGFTVLVAPSVANEVRDPDVKFDDVDKVLPVVLAKLKKENAELSVLLLQGSLDEATNVAKKHPELQLIVCLSKEEEPSAQAEVVGTTQIVSVGHKGRNLGVVGINRPQNAGQPFELRYQMVSLDPVFETPARQESTNPIHALIQAYADEVKTGDYLSKYPKSLHPMQVDFPKARYIGSERCGDCHPSAYQVWQAHPHSRAHDSLVKAKRPTGRQFDGECLRCHTVGFEYKTGFTSAEATPKLLNVGCESCHGPGSLHANNPNNQLYRQKINSLKSTPGTSRKAIASRIHDSCFKCHDMDNSVHFEIEQYWFDKKTVHPTPQGERQPGADK